jgi:hypothetical protein
MRRVHDYRDTEEATYSVIGPFGRVMYTHWRNSTALLADGLWGGRPGFDSRKAQDIFRSHIVRWTLKSIFSPTELVPRALCLEVKQGRPKADLSSSSIGEFESGGAAPPLPTSYHGLVLTQLSTETTLPFSKFILYLIMLS